MYPTRVQVDDHNKKVLEMFKKKNVQMFTRKDRDQLVDETRKLKELDLENITPKDHNECGGFRKESFSKVLKLCLKILM